MLQQKTRKAMLHLKPSRHEYWYALSLAWQLLGHFDEAIDVMITFEDIVEVGFFKIFLFNLIFRN